MTIPTVRRLFGRAAVLSLATSLVALPACDSTPKRGVEPGPVAVDGDTPEVLLASLKAAARQSLNGYYDAMRDVTDCEALPDICRLLSARAASAREMVALRNAMAEAYGAEGEAAGAAMLRGAFLEQFEAIERAEAYSSGGNAAAIRIGKAIYRMRRLDDGWRIVQFPDPPYDPAASADAIEIVVARATAIRKDVQSGSIPSVQDLELRLARLADG